MTSDWHSVVYGGVKIKEGDRQTSKNVQSPPEATGRAESNAAAPVDIADVELCVAKIGAMRAVGYSWQRIAHIGAVAKGTAWNYGNKKARPDAGFVERIMSYNAFTVRLTPVCPIHGVVHDAGPCATNKPVAAVVVLAPGERIVTPRGPWVSKAKPEVAAMVRGIEACLTRKAGPVPGVQGGV